MPLSPTAVREVLWAEGFAPLPRRLDEERSARPGPTVEPVADVREFSLVPDPGLALFCGLNAIPKKSFLSEYSSRLDHARTTSLLAAWHRTAAKDQLFAGDSFNLDFHSVPYYGEEPQVERHYVSMRSRRQPSVLAFLAPDAEG